MQNTHLDILENEAIHIFREAVEQAENPVMLYSIGKDSSVLLHLALKAFYPAIPPFPILHVECSNSSADAFRLMVIIISFNCAFHFKLLE